MADTQWEQLNEVIGKQVDRIGELMEEVETLKKELRTAIMVNHSRTSTPLGEPLDKTQLVIRMIRNAAKVKRECEQIIRDAEYWNGLNPDEEPFDVSVERRTIIEVQKVLDYFKAG